jgi:hypothetical protein
MVAMTVEGPDKPRTVELVDPRTREWERIDREPSSGPVASAPSLETITAHDGLEFTGWLFRPPAGAESVGAMMFLHGGPEGQGRPGYNEFFPPLLEAGITVFLPNVRGSGGFGRSFMHADDRERRFAAIDNVVAIKIAPFNRYRTLDVLRGVAAAKALDRITLYTGNDDHILLDLMLPFDLRDNGVSIRTHIRGGLLGHWSVWTAAAIRQFEACKAARGKDTLPADLLALDARVTDCNSAFFDVAHGFRGCIAGCHEVLRRQGLLEGTWCLDSHEGLGPGQAGEIDRVLKEHADLGDDAFVAARLEHWLA